MDYVSISAFNDADLLDGALASVREHLPDATIDVVDGAYSTWPGDATVSTDATAAVAEQYGARYRIPEGLPFEREVDKHRYRVSIAPENDRALFLDADERIVTADRDALDHATAYAVRIFNPLVYSESPIRYWPRCFYPRDVLEVSRWDKYLFDVPCDRTDAVTIAHRHDLRDREYREAKYKRFANEGRDGRYAQSIDRYLDNNWDVDTAECPACDADALTVSPVTNAGADALTAVEVCLDCEYRAVREYPLHDHRYLPDDWERGLDEDPERLRAELIDAGCSFVAMVDFTTVRDAGRLDEMAPAIRTWVADEFHDDGPGIFANE